MKYKGLLELELKPKLSKIMKKSLIYLCPPICKISYTKILNRTLTIVINEQGLLIFKLF